MFDCWWFCFQSGILHLGRLFWRPTYERIFYLFVNLHPKNQEENDEIASYPYQTCNLSSQKSGETFEKRLSCERWSFPSRLLYSLLRVTIGLMLDLNREHLFIPLIVEWRRINTDMYNFSELEKERERAYRDWFPFGIFSSTCCIGLNI